MLEGSRNSGNITFWYWFIVKARTQGQPQGRPQHPPGWTAGPWGPRSAPSPRAGLGARRSHATAESPRRCSEELSFPLRASAERGTPSLGPQNPRSPCPGTGRPGLHPALPLRFPVSEPANVALSGGCDPHEAHKVLDPRLSSECSLSGSRSDPPLTTPHRTPRLLL